MTHFKHLLLKLGLSGFGIFLLSSLITIDVSAISLGSYKPVSTRRIDQKRTVGSGSRSPVCQTDWEKDSLTLLIPEEEVVHHTVSSNPTFYIHAKQTSAEPLIFNIVSLETNTDEPPLLEKKIIVNKLGVNEISISSNTSLENNKLYLWQIGFPCKNDPTSVAKVVKGSIERITPTNELSEELNRSDSALEKAKIYAENGIWYDAIQLAKNNRDSSFFELLLEEINLETAQ